MEKVWFVIFSFFFIIVAGCATIVGSPHHVMPLASTPSEATIVITDETGTAVFKGVTPTTVTLQKSTGKYWGKKSYTVQITKDGFEPQNIQVTASANGWYLGGNIIFGGLIGWFIVDPLNGHMYNLEPENINATLSAIKTSGNTKADGSLSIMLIDDVPLEMRGNLKRIY